MAVYQNPENEFDFAYKGYQYPIPPSWKYAVRLQDQIQWLLQAILKVNAGGLSVDLLNEAVDELNASISATDAAAQGYADAAETQANLYTNRVAAALEAIIAGIQASATVRDPVTGNPAPLYTALKHVHDLAVPMGITWGELAEDGGTWAALTNLGVSWQLLAQKGGWLLGLRAPDNPDDAVSVTPTADIPTNTPGF